MVAAATARRGHPLRWESGANLSRYREPPQHLLCAFRAECLAAAARCHFPAFSCLNCPDAQPAALRDLDDERAGLIVLARIVLHPRRRRAGAIEGA